MSCFDSQLVANLFNSQTNEDHFFVLGSPALEVAPSKSFLRFSDSHVKSRSLLMEDPLPDFIPDGDVVPYAVALIYSTGRESGSLKLKLKNRMTKQKPYISLDDAELIEQLRAALVDMVIYGRRAKTDGCSVFEDLFPAFAGQHYLLREYDTNNGDFSLNRCSYTTENFVPRSFQLGPLSVLQRNICDSDFTPIIEMYSRELVGHDAREQPEEMETDDAPVAGTSGTCKPRSFNEEFYEFVSDEKVEELREENETDSMCPANEAGVESVLVEELDIDAAHSLLKKVFGENVPLKGEFEWDKDDHFKEEWVTFMKEHLNRIMPIDVFAKKSVRNWFVFRPNEQTPAISSYYCKQCQANYDAMHLSPDRKSDLARERGKMYTTKSQNRMTILNHEKSPGHLTVINGLKKRAAAKIPMLLNDAQKKHLSDDGIDLGPTMNHFRAVYIAVCKNNVAFRAYDDMVLMMQLNGADMGAHFGNYNGAAAITNFMSELMHGTLIVHILDSEMDFGLIVDETTDKSHKKYFAVLIQGMENDRPITYFYRSIEIRTVKVTAQNLFDALVEKFGEDGLTNAVKAHLVAFASDGAATMTAAEGGLARKLDDFTDRPLYKVHCLSHKIQLSLKEVTKKTKYHREMEVLLNLLHNFYGDHKKNTHYHQTGKYLGLKVLNLKRIMDVRWVTSEVQAIKTFQRVWVILSKDLNEIANDRDFDPKRVAQPKAGRLYRQVTNRSVLLYMHFFWDMVLEMVTWTELTQEHNALLIEQIRYKHEIIAKLEELKNPNDDPKQYGPKVREFFDDLECTLGDIIFAKNEAPGLCTEQHFYDAEQVKYKGYLLQPMLPADDPSNVGQADDDLANERATISSLKGPKLLSLRLRDIRVDVLTELQEQIEAYFPEESMESFDVMDPKNMPRSPNEFTNYGETDIRTLAKALGYENHVEDIVDGWLQLMEVFSQVIIHLKLQLI